jgi:predicted Zn-dependent protease
MSAADLQHRIRVCRQRLAAAPHSRAFAPLADALRLAGQAEEALLLLEDGLVRHPEFQAALVILGHTLLDTGRSVHARKVLQRVLEQDPDNVVVLRLLSEDARSRRAWQEAVPLLEKLAQLDPDENRWPRALAEARSNQTAANPTDVPETSFATMTLVEIYLAQGYRSKAMTALRQMQDREPNRADIREKIAEIGVLEGEADPTPAGGVEAAASGLPADLREVKAAKRAAEKQSFEAWISRIRSDEEARP